MAVIEDRGQNAEAVCTVALCLAIHSNEKTIPTLRADADVTQSQCHREAESTANQRETLNECCKCCQACHRARFTEGQQTWRYRGLATEVPRSNLGVRMRGFTFAWFTVSMGTGGLSLLLGVSLSSFHPSDCADVSCKFSSGSCYISLYWARRDRPHCVHHRSSNVRPLLQPFADN